MKPTILYDTPNDVLYTSSSEKWAIPILDNKGQVLLWKKPPWKRLLKSSHFIVIFKRLLCPCSGYATLRWPAMQFCLGYRTLLFYFERTVPVLYPRSTSFLCLFFSIWYACCISLSRFWSKYRYLNFWLDIFISLSVRYSHESTYMLTVIWFSCSQQIKRNEKHVVIIAVYIDSLLIFAGNKGEEINLKRKFSKVLSIKNLSIVKCLLATVKTEKLILSKCLCLTDVS